MHPYPRPRLSRKPIILVAEGGSDSADAWTFIDCRKLPWNDAGALGFAEGLQWARGLATSHDLRLVIGN
ncbi:MAG: hypothetical protein HOW73_44780 [Polyangiaceae bacterium]|nr:hypothetical protein [Polyangiaceae bacterium]